MADSQNKSLEQALSTSIQLDVERNNLLRANLADKKGVDDETLTKLEKLSANTASQVSIAKEQTKESKYQSKTLSEVKSSSRASSEHAKKSNSILSSVGSAIGFIASGVFKILTFPFKALYSAVSFIGSTLWKLGTTIMKTMWASLTWAFKVITKPLVWIGQSIWAVTKTVFGAIWATTKFLAKTTWAATKLCGKIILAPLYVGFKFIKWFANTWVGKIVILILAIWAIKEFFGSWLKTKWEQFNQWTNTHLDDLIEKGGVLGDIASAIDKIRYFGGVIAHAITHPWEFAKNQIRPDGVGFENKMHEMRSYGSRIPYD